MGPEDREESAAGFLGVEIEYLGEWEDEKEMRCSSAFVMTDLFQITLPIELLFPYTGESSLTASFRSSVMSLGVNPAEM